MSADNWTQCPRCGAKSRVPADQYGDRPGVPYSFREDYEIYGAEDGVVKVHYRGQCTLCALSLKFDDEHTITW